MDLRLPTALEPVVLLQGDALEWLPRIPAGVVDAVVTDPVWPNAPAWMFPDVDPWRLFADAMQAIPQVERLVVVLNALSDPRFLGAVPKDLEFVRVAWLRRTPPGYHGTVMISADTAYVFGHRRPNPPNRVLPGETQMVSEGAKTSTHPCGRSLKCMAWLLRHFTPRGGLVLDPFIGSGTTALACLMTGRRCLGIEISSEYYEVARKRVADYMAAGPLFDRGPAQGDLFADALPDPTPEETP